MHDPASSIPSVTPEVAAGASGYTRKTLPLYDRWVLGFYARYFWRCPNEEILALYNANVSINHLDIGVGTGFFLDNCHFSAANPNLALLDLNPECVAHVAERIHRYSPKRHVASVLDPLPLPPASFDSVGLNYVLHCLPGPMARKLAALKNVRAVLKDGGVLFGATLLGKGGYLSLPAQLAMKVFNKKGFFSNLDDDLAGLEAGLRQHFTHTSVRVVGGMAVFVARA